MKDNSEQEWEKATDILVVGVPVTQAVIERMEARVAQARAEMAETLEAFTVVDGFIGYTDEEWRGAQKICRFILASLTNPQEESISALKKQDE